MARYEFFEALAKLEQYSIFFSKQFAIFKFPYSALISTNKQRNTSSFNFNNWLLMYTIMIKSVTELLGRPNEMPE